MDHGLRRLAAACLRDRFPVLFARLVRALEPRLVSRIRPPALAGAATTREVATSHVASSNPRNFGFMVFPSVQWRVGPAWSLFVVAPFVPDGAFPKWLVDYSPMGDVLANPENARMPGCRALSSGNGHVERDDFSFCPRDCPGIWFAPADRSPGRDRTGRRRASGAPHRGERPTR